MQLLEKFGIAQFLNNTTLPDGNPTNPGPGANGNGSQNGGDPGLSVPYDTYDASFDMRQNGQFGTSSFSPFSPDPNYLADSIKNLSLSQPHPQQYSYDSKGYPSWYTTAPTQEEKASSNSSGKVSPASVGTSRPSSSNQRFSAYLTTDNSGGSPFQQNRASSRQEAPIARPDMGRRSSQVALSSDIQDLNGTLASLELDNTQWKPTSLDASRAALPTTP